MTEVASAVWNFEFFVFSFAWLDYIGRAVAAMNLAVLCRSTLVPQTACSAVLLPLSSSPPLAADGFRVMHRVLSQIVGPKTGVIQQTDRLQRPLITTSCTSSHSQTDLYSL